MSICNDQISISEDTTHGNNTSTSSPLSNAATPSPLSQYDEDVTCGYNTLTPSLLPQCGDDLPLS